MYAQLCARTRSGTESEKSDRDCVKTGDHTLFERRRGGGIAIGDPKIEIDKSLQFCVHGRLLRFSMFSFFPRTPTAIFCGPRASLNLCERIHGVEIVDP